MALVRWCRGFCGFLPYRISPDQARARLGLGLAIGLIARRGLSSWIPSLSRSSFLSFLTHHSQSNLVRNRYRLGLLQYALLLFPASHSVAYVVHLYSPYFTVASIPEITSARKFIKSLDFEFMILMHICFR